VELYVTNQINPASGAVQRPSLSASGIVVGYTWSSLVSPSRDRVTIPSTTDPSACQSCYYIVGVLGRRSNRHRGSDFSIVATPQFGVTTLQDGTAQQGEVATGDSKYYRISMTVPNTTLSIALTTFFGRANLYVAEFPVTRPSVAHHQWQSLVSDRSTLTLSVRTLYNPPYLAFFLSLGRIFSVPLFFLLPRSLSSPMSQYSSPTLLFAHSVAHFCLSPAPSLLSLLSPRSSLSSHRRFPAP